MSAALGLVVIALCLAVLGLVGMRRGRIYVPDGQGHTLVAIVNFFLAFVFLAIALLKGMAP